MSGLFAVTISRKDSNDRCTAGYLSVNGNVICYTLERPWENNENNLSSIPTGIYTAHLRYDHDDLWRIELDNVPGRTNVQIHIGNQVDQSTGCILVGMDHQGNDVCTLTRSAEAYRALKKTFYGTENPVSTPDLTISVTVEE